MAILWPQRKSENHLLRCAKLLLRPLTCEVNASSCTLSITLNVLVQNGVLAVSHFRYTTNSSMIFRGSGWRNIVPIIGIHEARHFYVSPTARSVTTFQTLF